MNLPNLFNTPSGSDQSLSFLSMVLTEKHLQSALAEITSSEVRIVEQSSLKEFATDEAGVVEADKSLQELGPESEEVNQVVFGFDPGWIGKAGLIETKKPFLKKLTESLGLQPAGFVVVTEAFIQNLLTDQPLLSAVCLYFQVGELHLFLLKQGKLFKKVSVGRSGEIAADLAEGLARLGKLAQKENQYLPAKILLVSSSLSKNDIEEQQQQILAHKWTEEYPFLQAPTVDILSPDVLLEAVAKQGGKAVAQARGINMAMESPSRSQGSVVKTPPTENNDDFGFTEVETTQEAEKKPLQKKPQVPETAQPEMEDSVVPLSSATSFGIPIGAQKLPDVIHNNSLDSDSDDMETAVPMNVKKTGKKQKKLMNFSHKKMIVLGVVVGLLALVGMGFGSLFFISTAQIRVKLKTISVAKDVEIILDPKAASSDPSKLILSASLVDKELSESDTYETTGVKLVGEKAKGKVTLFNKTQSVKTFEAGTVLSQGELDFTLDSEVQVASASVEVKSGSETKNYGQAEAAVTATEIGADSNLGKDTELSVASFDNSSYSAKTLDTLTGGSSREIRVVSEKDRSGLLADLTKTLSEKASEEFKAESGNGKYLVSTGNVTQKEVNFDAATGDEVESLKLDLTIVSQAISYSSDDLKPLAKEVLKDELPEGYDLLDQNPEILSSPTDQASASGKVVLAANLSSKAQPTVNPENWKSEILGRPFNQARSDLEGKQEIESVSFTIWPKFSEYIVKSLPRKSEKIEIVAE